MPDIATPEPEEKKGKKKKNPANTKGIHYKINQNTPTCQPKATMYSHAINIISSFDKKEAKDEPYYIPQLKVTRSTA